MDLHQAQEHRRFAVHVAFAIAPCAPLARHAAVPDVHAGLAVKERLQRRRRYSNVQIGRLRSGIG